MKGLYLVAAVTMAGVGSVFVLLAELDERYQLGAGSVVAARSIADGTAVGVALRRPGGTHPVEVVSLRPGSGDATTLLAANAIDITAQCWPLVPRPVEAGRRPREKRNSSRIRSRASLRRARSSSVIRDAFSWATTAPRSAAAGVLSPWYPG